MNRYRAIINPSEALWANRVKKRENGQWLKMGSFFAPTTYLSGTQIGNLPSVLQRLIYGHVGKNLL